MATFKPIVTTDELFDFMSVADDQRETHQNSVLNLLQQNQIELERALGRKITSQSSSVTLQCGQHFEYSNDYKTICLKGDLVDLYSITGLTEAGVSLTESTSYNDGGSFRFNPNTAELVRLNASWNTSDFAIVVTGKYGYVNSDDTPREDVKLVLKEFTAMKTGLWKKTFISDGGDVTVEKDKADKWLMDRLKGMRNISLI